MRDEVEHVQATFDMGGIISAIIGLLLTAAFGAWAFVVKHFGQQHIDSVRELALELRELRKDVNGLAARVQVVEYAQSHHHPE